MSTQAVPRKAEVLARLTEADVQRVYASLGVQRLGSGGEGYWLVRSPFREDRHPSMTIRKGDGGWSDKATGENGTIFDAVMRGRGCAFPEALAEVGRLVGLHGTEPHRRPQPPRLVEPGRDEPVYVYRDEQSMPLYEIIRRVLPDGRKSFVVRHPETTSAGGVIWRTGLGGAQRVLYRLPEVLAAEPWRWLFVVEGEKDVDRLWGIGQVATTNPFGAGKWDASYSAALAGRMVVIIPDNDEPGERHASEVEASLRPAASTVRVLRLPGLQAGGDVSDWLDAGGTAEELLRLAARTPVVTGDVVRGVVRDAEGSEPSPRVPHPDAPDAPDAPGLRAITTRLSDVQAKPVEWLWQDWLPLGKLTILGGHPGTGKSTLAAGFAALLSRGLPWPDSDGGGSNETRVPNPGHTIFLLGEDALDDTLRPRLDQLGADSDRVSGFDTVGDDKGQEYAFSLREHMRVLEAEIEREGARLVVIDPLTSFLPSANRNDEGDIRDLLTPLLKLAERTGCAIVGIMHVAKPSAAGRRTALQSLLGATAFGAIARSVLMTASVPDTDRNVLAVVKSNLAKKPQPIEWSRPDDGQIIWHGPTTEDVESILGGIPGSIRPEPRDAAEAFLRELLAAGPMPSREVVEAAAEEGISEITLRRARKALGVETQSVGSPRVWYMLLPGTDWDAFLDEQAPELAQATEEPNASESDEQGIVP